MVEHDSRSSESSEIKRSFRKWIMDCQWLMKMMLIDYYFTGYSRQTTSVYEDSSPRRA